MNKEIAYIQDLIAAYPRSSKQLNSPFHSDSEIIKLKDFYLGVSVDAISEEIELKVINDPVTLGWLTVTASVSDLAATGIMTSKISVLLKDSFENPEWANKFFEGIEEAQKFYSITHSEIVKSKGAQTLSACTAYGVSKEKPSFSRIGLKDNDILFTTGSVGWGNAVAFANIALANHPSGIAKKFDCEYRPKARSKEAALIKDFAQVCIDTSDGLIATLKWLEIFNQKQITLEYKKSLYHPLALSVAGMTNVNPWLFMAAQNGEFELVFSVAENRLSEFNKFSQENGLHFLRIGYVSEGSGIHLRKENASHARKLDLDEQLNMLHDGVDPEKYILNMLAFAKANDIAFED